MKLEDLQELIRKRKAYKEYKKEAKSKAQKQTTGQYGVFLKKKVDPSLKRTGRLASKAMRKIETGSTKKAGSAIERVLKGKTTKSSKQARILREKNRMLQMQLNIERRHQAELLAAQQRSSYETPSEEHYEQPQQPEQYQEDEYGRDVQQPSLMQGIWDRIKPHPGMVGRIQALGGLGSKSATGQKKVPVKRNLMNQAQIGTRYVHGMGALQKEDITPAPRISLLGGASSGGNSMGGTQPNILNTPQVSFFGNPSKKPYGIIK